MNVLFQVLKHPSCAVQTLILANISDGMDTSYEFDLLPAIASCRSLRCVAVVGGLYRRSFLCGLLSDIQTENPRVKEVSVPCLLRLFLERTDNDVINKHRFTSKMWRSVHLARSL
jgi:hypothetical protein